MSTWDYASRGERDEARDAYDFDDPKHPDFEDLAAERADMERKRLKEEGPMELATVERDELELFTGTKQERMEQMVETAQILAEPIRAKHIVSISGRDHVRVEGWTMLGAILGVYPYLVWTRMLRADDGSYWGWEARVEARTRDGSVVGSAEAMCTRGETTWQSRDDYAVRSMAQTRATSKALRQPLGFVISLAGFDPTPAEEMPSSSSEFRAPAGATDDALLSDAQRRKIYALYRELEQTGHGEAVDSDENQQRRSDYFGTFKISELTRDQASELIDSLEKARPT